MTNIKRWLAVMLAAILLIGTTGVAESFEDWFSEGGDAEAVEPSETPAPDTSPSPEPTQAASTLTDDGMLRLYLRSLDSPQKLNLTLEGVYAVEGDRGFRFEKGTRLTLTWVDGEVWLYAGGLQLDMGPALTLTRHLDGWGEAGGIVIDEAEKPTLYCGDLSVAAGVSSLRVILNIQIEDYLKGVVGYEMSDSFPIEALKAQAVAARTYAMQRKWASGKRDYDLVDTTADQVFKGFEPTYANVIEAVNETRGLVCVWNGAPATCYYTASNGGQTALASHFWGANDADNYLEMKDDPYDLENPRSLENDLTFTARCDGSLKLKQLLTSALKSVMAEAGFPADAWEFDSIENIEPIEPRYAGSRLYDKLAFDVKVRVAESALATPTPAASTSPEPTAALMDKLPMPERWVVPEQTYRVTLNVFDDIKDGLSLGLNSADCELISVETVEGVDGGKAFRLIMRRYGHGVGMSQRGAQQMAGGHRMDYMSILNFYYPGLSIERVDWTGAPVSALDEASEPVGAARPKPTPIPTPAPLPALQPGERYATVTATTLNLREQPSTASRVLDFFEKGRRVVAAATPDANGWVAVHTAEVEGYVKAEYLE